MTSDSRPAVLFVRMSHQLRDGLRAAAEDAGCSLNSFAIQVLAAAAGDPSRFRAARAAQASEVPEIERDERGFPLGGRARMLHIHARTVFVETMSGECGFDEGLRLVKKYDAEDPAHFVEWLRLKGS